jgi:signal peptidase II
MVPYLIILLAFSADRLSKIWAAAYYAENGPTTFHSLLHLRQTYNRGIALGMFQGIGPIVGWLSIGVIVGLFIYLVQMPRDVRLLRVGLAFIIGGALGNLVDRVTVGHVLDFIATPLLPSVFNVADIMIYSGLFLVLVVSFFSQTSPFKGSAT